MPNQKSYDPVEVDPSLSDDNSVEEAAEKGFEEDPTLVESTAVVDLEDYEGLEVEDTDWEEDLALGTLVDTQHEQGHTYNPTEAWEQGLVYTPPDDPPIVPSEDDLQGAEIAAGFAPSMEQTDPDVEDLPDRVDNSDLDLQDDIYTALRYNSETQNIADQIEVTIENGVVTLTGTVLNEADIALVDEIISDLEGVVEVDNQLEVEDFEP